MPNNTKVDTPAKKVSTQPSIQINNTITLADIMKKLKTMEESQNNKYKSINDKLISYEGKINIINNSLDGILSAISILRDENVALKNKISSLDNKITFLESTSNVNCTLSSDEVINEAQNRLVKSKNIIVFNVLELPNESDNTSLSVAKELLSDIALDLDIIQAKRIGNARSGGRPLLLKFNDANESRLLLRNKSKLRSLEKWKNVWVNADLTQYQQVQMKSLRNILQQKRADGDFNSIIKYVNGVPKIVSKN